MATHTAHALHANSLSAFDSLDINKRESLILSAYALARAPMTDRECMTALGFTDMNAVRPRVTSLVASGYLWECGVVRDETTGRRVRACTTTSLARGKAET